jgi:archaellum component FlaC
LGVVAEAMLSRVLEESVNRIARKVAEGKKLSDQEIVILYLDIIMRSNERRFEAIDKRFNDLKEYVDKRINDLKDYVDKRIEAVDKRLDSIEKRIDSLERRVELVYNEVSSIKTDIIKMMKEYMERLYGGKRG